MSAKTLKAVRILAPEDIAIDQWVAVHTMTAEFYPCWAIESPSDIDRIRMVRFDYAPDDAGQPLRVIDVCLPYVFVKSVNGAARVLDLRSVTLVAVSPRFARAVRKCARESTRNAKAKPCDSS